MSDDYQYSNRVILEDESAYRKKRLMRFGLFILAIVAMVFTCKQMKSDEMIVYNGFSQNVTVMVGEESYYIAPERFVKADIKFQDSVQVVSMIDGDTIDNFIPNSLPDADEYIYNVGHAAAFYEYEVIYMDKTFNSFNGFSGLNNSFNTPEADSKIIGAPRWFGTSADYVLVEAPEEIEISRNQRSVSKWQLEVVSDLSPQNSIGWMLEGAENIKEMLVANAMYSGTEDPQLTQWVTYAAYMDDENLAVKHRLTKNPNEVVANRALMDTGSDEEKAELCASIATQLETKSENPDLNYLNCRCIEDKAVSKEAFLKAYEKWPNHGWLAFAAGHLHAGDQDWDSAIDAFGKSMTLEPAAANHFLYDIYRLKRHTKKGAFSGAYLFEHDEDIKYIQALRSGNEEEYYDESDDFYNKLRLMKYTAAGRIAETSYESNLQKLLFDLSRQAPDLFHEELLESDAYIDAEGDEFFLAAAFSVKHDVDLSRGTNWSYTLETLEIDEAKFNAYLAALKSKNMSRISSSIEGLTTNFVTLIKLKGMARIVMGENLPDSWLAETTNMLYVNEKPVY